MTLKTRLPLHIFQKFFLVKDIFDSFFIKLEAITNSITILYSIRILIVFLALLMGYVHTPKDKTEVSSSRKSEIADTHSKQILEDIK